jgi:hypothetical protein
MLSNRPVSRGLRTSDTRWSTSRPFWLSAGRRAASLTPGLGGESRVTARTPGLLGIEPSTSRANAW